MLKAVGALTVCAVCMWWGCRAAESLRRRKVFLESFVTSLSALETEIVFGRYELGDIFSRADPERKLCGLYQRCAAYLPELGIRKAWRRSAEEAAEAAELTAADTEIISSFGRELGMSDPDGQVRAIRRITELIGKNAEEADERYRRLSRVYRGCGILTGIFAVLVLV